MVLGHEGKIIRIPNTLKLLCGCWAEAEEMTRQEIKSKHSDADEPNITWMFHGNLKKRLEEASNLRAIETKFLEDLRRALTGRLDSDLRAVARGLVAEVTLHDKKTEGSTGGDLGLEIRRPHLKLGGEYAEICEYRRGILCQAKLKRVGLDWGGFTENQKEVLPHRLSFLALLLYRYRDADGEILESFEWQSCNEADAFAEVDQWLRNDHFPSPVPSETIIRNLGDALLGTDDPVLLDTAVSPTRARSLIIELTWRGRKPPQSRVRLRRRGRLKQKIQIPVPREG